MAARIFTSIVGSLALALLLVHPTYASYMPPEELESYWFISNSWKISDRPLNSAVDAVGEKSGPVPDGRILQASAQPVVEVTVSDRQYRFPIDLFLLAHYTNSDSICVGDYRATMKKYIEQLREKPPTKAMIRLSVLKKNGPLMVSSITRFDAKRTWDRAIQEGSQILDLSAAKVRQLKSADGYEAELMKRSQSQWELIKTRPKTKASE